MIDEEEWDWIAEHARGSFDHLIVATTLPAFAPHGIHHLESWNEAVCDGCWRSFAAQIAERLRRAVDLEHWAAFQRSFERLVDLLRAVSRGLGGNAPATITILSGDVHTTYVAEIDLGIEARADSRSPGRLFTIQESSDAAGTARRTGNGVAHRSARLRDAGEGVQSSGAHGYVALPIVCVF